ncbi:GumC family protein [Lichenicoccus sp.]|uniref:GumC family protein n=1 Tax=Lichenicoccus sp. TaxID=2781899 RepID=UPI003D0F025A
MAGLGAPDYVSPVRALSIFRRRKLLVACVVILVSVPVTAYITTIPPYFDSEATLALDMRKSAFSDLQASDLNAQGDTLTVRTQTDILDSTEMAGRVVDALDLVQSAPVQRLLHTPEPRYRVLLDSLLGPKQPDQAAERLPRRVVEREVAIGWLRDRVTIANDGRSYTLTIKARTGNGLLSARIANAYAAQYLAFNRELKTTTVARGNALLDQQIAPLQRRVTAAEQAAEQFRERNGLVVSQRGDGDGSEGHTIAEQQLDEANSQLLVAQGDLARKQSELAQAAVAFKSGRLDEIPTVDTSPLIQRLRDEAVEAQSRETMIGQSAGSANPALVAARATNASVRRALGETVQKTLTTLQSDVNGTKLRVTSLQDNLAGIRESVFKQSRARVELQQLESEAAAARAVYREFLARFEQTSSEATLQEPDANLVTTAQPPVGVTGPMRLRLIALAGIAGLVSGCGIALGLERSRKGVRTLEQLEAETGLFPLGFVPVADKAKTISGRKSTLYTESITGVRRMLRFGSASKRAKVVLVTSAARGEGKTFFAVSLAASLGREGGRALLIDGDLRDPGVHKSLDMPQPQHGADTGTGTAVRLVMQEDALTGVDVVSFRPPADGGPAQLDTGELQDLVDRARDRYDLIVLDAPPVLAVSNAAVMAQIADGTIFVVRWSETPPVAIRSALRTLQAFGVRVLGGVLTQVRVEELSGAEGGYGHVFKNISGYFRA